MITIEHVNKRYGSRTLYDDMSLNFEDGLCYQLNGANGSGKSVLLKMICGYTQVDSGRILIDGQAIGEQFDFIPRAGVLINSPEFLGHYSCLENLKILARLIDKPLEPMLAIFAKLGGEVELHKKYKNLSLGTKQKLRLAQALAYPADYYILDEPLNALDKESTAILFDLLRQKKKDAKVMIITDHRSTLQDLPLDDRLIDRILLLEQARVSQL